MPLGDARSLLLMSSATRSEVSRTVSLRLLRRVSCGVIALAMVPGAASAAPTITLNTPVVDDYGVSLSASLTSNGSCGAGFTFQAGCPANYTITGPQGFSGANLWWNDSPGSQGIQQDFDMGGYPAGTYTVTLVAIDAAGMTYSSNAEQFRWPSGQLTVANIALTGEARPRLSYRIRHGRTPFASAKATITFTTPAGRRLGSFRRRVEPGLNLHPIPRRLRARLQDARRYVVRITVRDQHGRTATSRSRVRA
jgi:hypothetical protein